MKKRGQIKILAQAMTIIFIVLIITLSVTLIIRSSLLKNQILEFNDPAPLQAPLRGSIMDKNGILLAIDSRSDSEHPDVHSSGRMRTYPYTIPSLLRLLGDVDEEGNAINGIEKLSDSYLIAEGYKDKDMFDGIHLSVDINLISNIESALRGIDGETHVIVMDMKKGETIAIWDNLEKEATFDDQIYSMNDLSASPLINAYLAAAMAEIDPTRLFDYVCTDMSKCPISHGEINIDNLSSCQSAVDEMLKSYTDAEIEAALDALVLDDFRITSFLNSFASIVLEDSHNNMHILSGVTVNKTYKPFKIDTSPEAKVSSRISDYFEDQLTKTSPNEVIVNVNDEYAVYVSHSFGRAYEISDIIKNIILNY